MKFKNKLDPTEEQILGFNDPGPEPIFMLNLLKYKDKAIYTDGRHTSMSGKEAYAIYGKEVIKHLEKVGGKLVFAGDVSRLMIGEIYELWDSAAIAMYPSKKAMLKMITDPDYMKSHEHRAAGLEGQLNIELGSSQKLFE